LTSKEQISLHGSDRPIEGAEYSSWKLFEEKELHLIIKQQKKYLFESSKNNGYRAEKHI
jgi:hypothetical protein